MSSRSCDVSLPNSIRSVPYKRHCCPATDCLFTATVTLCRALAYPPVPLYLTRPHLETPYLLPFIAGSTLSTVSYHLSILLFHCLHSLNFTTGLLTRKYQFGQDPRDLRWGVFQVGPVFRASPVGPNIALPSQVLPFPSSSFQLKIPFLLPHPLLDFGLSRANSRRTNRPDHLFIFDTFFFRFARHLSSGAGVIRGSRHTST